MFTMGILKCTVLYFQAVSEDFMANYFKRANVSRDFAKRKLVQKKDLLHVCKMRSEVFKRDYLRVFEQPTPALCLNNIHKVYPDGIPHLKWKKEDPKKKGKSKRKHLRKSVTRSGIEYNKE